VTDFVHRFTPGSTGATILLLHGTGGSEDDLLPLGRALAPGAALLSPRGQVLERGMPRFFRRLAEGVFDEDDLRARAGDLAGFVGGAAGEHGFDPSRVVAAGFSNGANIAAAVLLLHPGVLRGAALFAPMVPLTPDPLPDLDGVAVHLSAGRADPIAPPRDAERLATLLTEASAAVDLRWHGGGHELGLPQVRAAADWMAKLLPAIDAGPPPA